MAVSSADFVAQFSEAEQQAILAAGSRNIAIMGWLYGVTRSQTVSKLDTDFMGGIGLLLTSSVIDQSKYDALVAFVSPPPLTVVSSEVTTTGTQIDGSFHLIVAYKLSDGSTRVQTTYCRSGSDIAALVVELTARMNESLSMED